MKRQIRQSCFETNSSSTHAICIATGSDFEIPKIVKFGFGEFGWEIDKLSSKSERADYLYTCLACINDFEKIKEYLLFISNTLHKHGVKDIDFEDLKIELFDCDGEIHSYIAPKYGYVDHGYEALEFVEAVCTDEWLLLDYLFSDDSFILTGNDNDDIETVIDVDYPHKEFYKDN